MSMEDALRTISIKEILNKKGLKATPQRMALLHILAKNKCHPYAEAIYEELSEVVPGIGKGTVYSMLKSLEEAGIIQEISTLGAIRRFDGNRIPHPHLLCTSCNKIIDIDPENQDISSLESFVERKTNYKVMHNSYMLYGTCPECRASKNQ